MNKRYKVVFSGRVVDGETVDNVKKNLSARLKIKPSAVDKYFLKSDLVIKNDIDHDAAKKIQYAFKKCGAICNIESVSFDVFVPTKKENSIENLERNEVVVEGEVVESLSVQKIMLTVISILVRACWSFTIGMVFFTVGLVLFIIIDIIYPKSNRSYEILTTLYKWGSCHWFKQLKLETEDFDIQVKKSRK